MSWPDDLAQSLPAPQDDDPPSLRAEIADELADHLQSALARERLHGQDEIAARRTVLERFGDPAAVARRLWFDALRERIMSQRILLALVIVLAVSSLGAVGMTWRLVEQSRASNEALMEHLVRLSERRDADRPPDWNPVRVRVVRGTKEGEPAPGIRVSLRRLKSTDPRSIELLGQDATDSDGLADLGLVTPGRYMLAAETTFGERTSRPVTISPGSTNTLSLVAPPDAPKLVSGVTIRIDWPDDLRNRGLYTELTFNQRKRVFDGTDWGASWDGLEVPETFFYVGVDPQGALSSNAFSQYVQEFYPPQPRGESAKPTFLKTVEYALVAIEVKIELPSQSESRPLALTRLASHEYAPRHAGFGSASDARFDRMPHFRVVEEETPNEWRIELPAPLVDEVRKQLANGADKATEVSSRP